MSTTGTDQITSIADIVRVHAVHRPGTVALHVGDRAITFADLDTRSSQAAQAFRAAGVGHGDRVAFIEKNGAEYFETTFALAKLGAVTVAVNWRLAPPEMLQIIDDAGAEVIVVGAEFFDHIEKIEDRLTSVRTIVAIGKHDRWPDFADWIAGHPAEDPHEPTTLDDVAFQLYTSGTTGLPKGVMLTNNNFFGGLVGIVDQWRFTEDSVNLALMPMFHIAGAGWATVGLYFGCTNVVMRDVDPAAILEAIPRHRITNAFLVPAVIQFLMIMPDVGDTDFSSLRAIVYGASPISDDVLTHALKLFGCEFIQVYGLTETTGAITQLEGADHDPEHRPGLLRSCGKPYPWVEVRVVDDDGQDTPPHVVGELWTKSRQVMAGYWNNPKATASAIDDDGWFRTGDAAFLDEDGYIFLFDRVKDMIVTGGENVYPAEVENALMEHPDVGDVAVFGVPDDK